MASGDICPALEEKICVVNAVRFTQAIIAGFICFEVVLGILPQQFVEFEAPTGRAVQQGLIHEFCQQRRRCACNGLRCNKVELAMKNSQALKGVLLLCAQHLP